MPLQRGGARQILTSLRNGNQTLSTQGVIVATVLEVFAETPTYFESEIRSDSHVAVVEEAMDVGSEAEPVLNVVGERAKVGLNVGRFKDRQ